MDKRGMKPVFSCLTVVVFLVPMVGSMGAEAATGHPRMVVRTNSDTELLGPARAGQEDCRIEEAARSGAVQAQCMWDEENFQGNMKAADLSGQCTNHSIRSAANNGKSGSFTFYLYEEPNCGGPPVSRLNAGESVPAVVAESARFAPKDS